MAPTNAASPLFAHPSPRPRVGAGAGRVDEDEGKIWV